MNKIISTFRKTNEHVLSVICKFGDDCRKWIRSSNAILAILIIVSIIEFFGGLWVACNIFHIDGPLHTIIVVILLYVVISIQAWYLLLFKEYYDK